jgi:hypothetical protein
MQQNTVEEEMETQQQVGRMPLFPVAICLTLSVLCGLLWVFLLLWPQMLTAFR